MSDYKVALHHKKQAKSLDKILKLAQKKYDKLRVTSKLSDQELAAFALNEAIKEVNSKQDKKIYPKFVIKEPSKDVDTPTIKKPTKEGK